MKATGTTSESINQYDLWYRPDAKVIRARRFTDVPTFYPVYRAGELYSWSLLELIRHRKCIDLNPTAGKLTEKSRFEYLPAHELPVRGVERIGGPLAMRAVRHRSVSAFVDAMAQAMVEDIRGIEARLRGFTNIVLTGGKDSLTLLLLPWSNPVVVASAAPNATLVKRFLDRNRLGHAFVELRNDDDVSLLREEVLSNCGRIDIAHMRWQKQCRELGRSLDGKAVFWGGSLGDTFMTRTWWVYRDVWSARRLGVLGRLSRRVVGLGNRLFPMATQNRYLHAAWTRGAMWQGVSKAIHREVTGCLSLSGYHGDAVLRTLSETALWDCVRQDVRPLIGAAITGRLVEYPAENPAPPATNRPADISSLQSWVDAMREEGMEFC
jgi:hypothetical protein